MFRNRNQVVLPLEIEKIIPKDDSVFKLAEICDKLDYSRLEKEYTMWKNFVTESIPIVSDGLCLKK